MTPKLSIAQLIFGNPNLHGVAIIESVCIKKYDAPGFCTYEFLDASLVYVCNKKLIGCSI